MTSCILQSSAMCQIRRSACIKFRRPHAPVTYCHSINSSAIFSAMVSLRAATSMLSVHVANQQLVYLVDRGDVACQRCPVYSCKACFAIGGLNCVSLDHDYHPGSTGRQLLFLLGCCLCNDGTALHVYCLPVLYLLSSSHMSCPL